MIHTAVLPGACARGWRKRPKGSKALACPGCLKFGLVGDDGKIKLHSIRDSLGIDECTGAGQEPKSMEAPIIQTWNRLEANE